MFPKHLKTKSDEDLTIREANATDASALIEYMNQVIGESDFLTFGVGDFDKTIEEEEKIINAHSNVENKIFLVATIEEKIVGVLNVGANSKPRMRHIGEFGITVRKDHWGKGIGSHLIKEMLEWAKSSHIIRKINLTVQIDNETAVVLYKKFGFEIEGTIRRDFYVNGKFCDAYVMGILID